MQIIAVAGGAGVVIQIKIKCKSFLCDCLQDQPIVYFLL